VHPEEPAPPTRRTVLRGAFTALLTTLTPIGLAAAVTGPAHAAPAPRRPKPPRPAQAPAHPEYHAIVGLL